MAPATGKDEFNLTTMYHCVQHKQSLSGNMSPVPTPNTQHTLQQSVCPIPRAEHNAKN